MVITPSQNRSGVWDSSRLRTRLAAQAVPVLVEGGRNGALANLISAPVDFPSVPETVPLYRLKSPEIATAYLEEKGLMPAEAVEEGKAFGVPLFPQTCGGGLHLV
ncbi:hypothetical protein J2129_000605 [Methanofollis sp. W23]|uniref:hypothetical protein n=1 Tax=Methanofollis sp. W23 TaxID=2817849 RepID=UPI001AE9095E|nr:hypothetical protein [Methanofollis sp. W23]MBP2145151.1 hypothetical protein [Methanofollis sp. W23]